MKNVGDIVQCTVTGFKEYGIFVYIDEVYNGLIHISEISENYVRNVHDYSELGDIIYAKILEIDEVNKQMKLSIKNINYKVDGNSTNEIDKNGFMPLKQELNVWINEKIKEMNKYNIKNQKKL